MGLSGARRAGDRHLAGPPAADEGALLHRLIADLPGSSDSSARLLDRLDTLAAVLSARAEQIASIADDATAERLGSIKGVCDYLVQSDLRDRPLLDATSVLTDYLRTTMSGLIVEEVRALYLNVKARLIRDEIVSRGSVNETSLFPREIIRRALELGATSIILAHNHPSGDTEPSQEDITITRQIGKAAAIFNISLLDHFVVSRRGCTSFRAQGLL